MKSAVARSQATGILQTTATRSRALTSGSCGCGSSGSQIDLAHRDPGADLLVTAVRAAPEAGDR